MKKALYLLMTSIIMLTLVACGSEETNTESVSTSSAVEEETPYNIPYFDDVEIALENLQSEVFGSSGWNLIFNTDKYVYATYSEYGDHMIRYNMETNSIDRALNLTGMQTSFKDGGELAYYFTADGRYALLSNVYLVNPGFVPENEVDRYIYKADFEEQNVSLNSKTQEAFVLPDEYVTYDEYDPAKYNIDYTKLTCLDNLFISASNPTPNVGEYVEIDEDTVVIIMPIDNNRSLELGYYKFIVVDVSEDKIVQECLLNPIPA